MTQQSFIWAEVTVYRKFSECRNDFPLVEMNVLSFHQCKKAFYF